MSEMKARSLAREISDSSRLVIAAAGALLAVILASVAWVAVVSEPATNRASATYQASEDVHNSLLDLGASVRGYVVTGLPSARQAATAASASFHGDLNALLASSDGRVRADARALARSEQTWEDDWARHALAAEDRHILTKPGALDSRDLTRFVVGGWTQFLAAESAQQRLTTAARTQANAAKHSVVLVVGAVAVVLVLIAAVVVGATVRRRRRLHRNVLEPIATLLERVRQVGRGDMSASFAVAAPHEILELRDELVEMTTSLRLTQHALQTQADEAAQGAKRLEQVVAFAREVTSSLTLGRVLDATARSGARLLSSDRARVWLLQPDGQTLRLEHAIHPDDHRLLGTSHLIGGLGVGRAIAERRLTYSLGLSGEDYSETEGVLALGMPLLKGSRPIGVLEVALSHRTRRLRADAVQILEAMAGHAATAIDAALLYARVETLSLSDSLTGLANRRRLDQDLTLEVERVLRQNGALSFLMVDVDHFKKVNDAHGHAAGDDVLRAVGSLLAGEMRVGDSVYRYGGEEFAVLLRDTDQFGASIVAERLRRAIGLGVRDAGGAAVTVSVGVSSLPVQALSADTLVQLADEALYAAKRAGRNRVMTPPSAVRTVGATLVDDAVPMQRTG